MGVGVYGHHKGAVGIVEVGSKALKICLIQHPGIVLGKEDHRSLVARVRSQCKGVHEVEFEARELGFRGHCGKRLAITDDGSESVIGEVCSSTEVSAQAFVGCSNDEADDYAGESSVDRLG